jgi:hypothetical protein
MSESNTAVHIARVGGRDLVFDWVWARRKLTLWGVSYLPGRGRFYVCPLPGIGFVVKFDPPGGDSLGVCRGPTRGVCDSAIRDFEIVTGGEP